MKSAPTLEYSENRGAEDNPYGFVYFVGNVRVGYSPGITGDDYADLWPGNWGPVTIAHLKIAGKHLQEEKLLPLGELKIKLPNGNIVTSTLDNLV